MLHFLPGPIKGVIAILLISMNTLLICLSIYPIALIRWLFPRAFKPFWTRFMSGMADFWITTNNFVLDLTQRLELDVQGLENLHRDQWYLVTCNHQTWADILLLQRICLPRIPMLKFFLKQVLIWVPVIGIAWWALDFPFMKRYTREQIENQPDLQGKDLETTRMACEVFKTAPVSVLNFLEGTRFTPLKHQNQQSPYKHLLKPRSGGTALVLNVLEQQIDVLIDITIVYPESAKGFWDFLCGRIPRVIIRVTQIQIPRELCQGDYEKDTEFKTEFQNWINQIWVKKDSLIEDILSG
ncbi:MAG: acyltransferase [Gammaproteobacteria bacterium]|nr:acyltransferase [Gammaproteobacteria bacterium]